MRILLAQLAPVKGAPSENAARIDRVLAATPHDLAVLPELFLTGYRVGDRIHTLALRPSDPLLERLQGAARSAGSTLAVGGPVALERPGEVANDVVVVPPAGPPMFQAKRYLPAYGPFEEGNFFTPTDRSVPIPVRERPVGFMICYDAFFPEVGRELALGGAELLVAISAAPITSRRLFEKVLPARAVENAVPVVYVNRVGVEDGVVFGGGTGAWDARGEPIPLTAVPLDGTLPEEGLWSCEVDLDDAPRWRPFRPVLRDVATRPPERSHPSRRTDRL